MTILTRVASTVLIVTVLLAGLTFILLPVSQPVHAATPQTQPAPDEDPVAYAKWFYAQRAFPSGIPVNAYSTSLAQAEALESQVINTPGPTSGSWVSVGPNPIQGCGSGTSNLCSGRVTAIAPDPGHQGTLYIGGAQGGVWKSIDGGTTWSSLTDNQPSLAVGSIAIDSSSNVYVGTGEASLSCDSYYGAGILKSIDGGSTWSQLGVSTFGSSSISRVLINPSNNAIVLASNTYGVTSSSTISCGFVNPGVSLGVYRSTDSGSTWTQTLSTSSGVSDIAVDPTNPNNVYAGVLYSGVYASSDGGQTWSGPLGGGLPSSNVGRIALGITPSPSVTLFAAIASSSGATANLYESTTGGASWSLVSTPAGPFGSSFCYPQCWYDIYVAPDPTSSSTVYLGGMNVYRTTNGGVGWTDLGGYSGNVHPDQHALAFSPFSHVTVYIGNDGGVWSSASVSTCSPTSCWANLNSGLGLTQFQSLAASPTDSSVYFGGTQDNGSPQHSGTSNVWSQLIGGDGGWTAFDPSNSMIMYHTFYGISPQRSTDGGVTWSYITSGLNTNDNAQFYVPMAIDHSVPTTLYLGTYRLYKTTSSGSTWFLPSPGLVLSSGKLSAIGVAPSNSGDVYAGTSTGRFFVSSDGGSTFAERDSGLPTRFVTKIAINPTNPQNVFLTFSGFGGQHVYLSTNAGASWTDITSNLPDSPTNSIAVDPSGQILYVGTDVGAFVSSNSGTSWAALGTGLPHVSVFDLVFASDGTLLAATHGRGVWKLPPTVSSSICGMTLTSSYTLTGNVVCNNGYGPSLAGSGITLNCAGYQIVGAGGGRGITLQSVTGDTVENCFVSNFQLGIALMGPVSQSTLTGNTANDNSFAGFYCTGSSPNTLTGNTASGDQYGYYFTSCTSFPYGSSWNTLAGNTAMGNSLGGFYIGTSYYAALTNNVAYSNAGNGFDLAGAYYYNLASNTANGNAGDGFYVTASGGGYNNLNGNAALNNGANGFEVDSSSNTNSFTSNSANSNVQFGYLDASVGSGTSGTGNTYATNTCSSNSLGGSSPVGICSQTPSEVTQPLKITMSNGQAPATVTVNGCSPSPPTFPGDGSAHDVVMSQGCSFTLSFSNTGNSRDGFIVSGAFSATSSPYTSSSSEIDLTAYLQLNSQYAYSISGGGTPTAPILTGTYLGTAGTTIATLTTALTAYWIDAGTSCSVTNPTAASTTTERWDTRTACSVSTGGTDTFVYYHQYGLFYSYQISGGGSPTAPGLSCTQFGGVQSMSLTGSVVAYWCDSGQPWTVSPNTLIGSGSTERWQSSQTSTGTVSAAQTIVFTYYHQYYVSASYLLIGGGTPTAPTFTYTLFGGSKSVVLSTTAKSFWADSAPYASTNPLGKSTSTNRWDSPSPSGTISAAGSLTIRYYHQYLVTFKFSVTGGGSGYSSPLVTVSQFGAVAPVSISNPLWVDASSAYTYPSTLPGSSSTERWFLSSTGGTISASGTISKTYVHQFYVTIVSSGPGTTSPSGSKWYNAGATITIKATPSTGHKFVNWSSSTGAITFANSNQVSTTATINGSGTITANFQ